MNAKEFVKRITDLRPNGDELNTYDFLNGIFSADFKEFVIEEKSGVVDEDPIITLVKSYDLSSLDINNITLDNDYFDDGEYFCFGWDATGDRIAIYKSNGRIVAYDVYGDRITFQCAENSEKFLEALVEIMKFYKEKGLNDYDEETVDNRSKEVAYIAALKAGGEEYEDYYKSVLWVE